MDSMSVEPHEIFNNINMYKSKSNFIFIISCLLTLVNLGVSFAIQKFDIWHVNNYNQEFFRFGWVSFLVIISIGLLLIIKLKLYQKYQIILSILITGTISNVIEKISQGYVVDYFNFGIGIANLADLYIYIGILIITYRELSTNYNNPKSLFNQ